MGALGCGVSPGRQVMSYPSAAELLSAQVSALL